MNISWILAVITILGLILAPFLIVHSSIHNYFIALEDGELLTPGKFFACVNSFCYYFKNSVQYFANDYVEVRYKLSGSIMSKEFYWLFIFILSSGLALKAVYDQ